MFVFVGILVFYSTALCLLTCIWKLKTSASIVERFEIMPSVSVLVAFRNEKENLEALVSSLSNQTHSNFEVLFIDDHSDDSGAIILKELLNETNLQWRIIQLQNGSGKKAALKQGISAAQFDLIVTTDADCIHNAQWLENMVQPFIHTDVQMVLGPVMLTGKSLWQKLQSIEFSPLIGVTAVMAFLGKPIMANGANLAYRKSAFETVGGFQGIDGTPSGDDELLMYKMRNQFRKTVVFQSSPQALVTTEAFRDWRSFSHQRLRWASKWKVGKRPATIISAIIVFLIQMSQLIIIGCLISGYWYNELLLGALIIKLMAELVFIVFIRNTYSIKTSVFHFALCFILYPFYAVYFGLAANFKNFEWKGRKYTSEAR